MDSEVPEQVIDVPKISQDRIQQRLVDRDLRHSQMAEQLVEVPTVLSPSLIAEQIVDIPVPRGRGGSDGGGLQGFLQEQNSTVLVSKQIVANPVRSPDFKKVRSPPGI